MMSRLRILGLTVASVTLLGSAVAVACADEVKGPVHITSRGVEQIDRYDPDHSGRRTASVDLAQRESDRARRKAERERAQEMAEALREALRDTAREKAELAREAAESAREALREAGLERAEEAREVARAARDAARDIARHAREIARAARDAARETLRGTHQGQTIVFTPDFTVPLQRVVVMHEVQRAVTEPMISGGDGLDGAEADLARQAAALAEMQAGNFSGVVIVRDGVTKCGDVEKQPSCQPLTDADRAQLVTSVASALSQARDGIEQAGAGLRAAQLAMNGQTAP